MALISAAVAATMALCTPFHDEASGLYGYHDCNGAIGIEAKYFLAQEFSEGGIAAVVDEEGWLYIDRQGNSVIRPMVYDNGPDYFSEGLARYIENGRYGYFDENGRVVLPAQYEFALPFENGSARVGHDCSFEAVGEHSEVDCKRWTTIAR